MSKRARLAGALAMLLGVAPAAGAQAVHGQLWAADGTAAAGLRVRVSAGAWADSATTDVAGRFRVAAAPAGDSIRVVVDAADPTARRFHPSVVSVPRGEAGDELRMIVVPRRWTIRAGAYQGESAEIDATRGFAPPCTGCRAGFFSRTVSQRAGERTITVPAWRPGSFPLRVAFDHEYTSEAISGRDSAAFWHDVGELERYMGMHLFRPARFADTEPEGDGPDDVVLVWVERGMRAAGFGSVAYIGGGYIGYGAVRLQHALSFTRPDTPELILHEMIHTLGVGHTCAWRSVMADVARCPGQRSPTPTVTDVAYVQLHIAMSGLQRAHRARWGLDAALRGEQEVENAPVPSPSLANAATP